MRDFKKWTQGLPFCLLLSLFSISAIHSITSHASSATYPISVISNLQDPLFSVPSLYYNSINNAGMGQFTPKERLDVDGDIHVGGQASTHLGTRTAQAMVTLYNYNFGIAKFTDPLGLRIFTAQGTPVQLGSTSIAWPYTSGSTTPPFAAVQNNFTPFLTVTSGGTSTGNVGIGTISPSSILQVGGGGRLSISNSGSGQTEIGTYDTDVGYNNSSIVIQGVASSTSPGSIQYYSYGGSHLWYTATGSYASAVTLRMTLSNSGNLGIGNANPQSTLAFANSMGEKITFWGESNTANFGIGVGSTSIVGVGTTTALQIHSESVYSDIAFGYRRRPTGTSFTETLRIKGSGNIGIGTTTPDQMLSVAGGINIDAAGANAGDLTNGVTFGHASGEGIAYDSTHLKLNFFTSSTNRMTILKTGNVGIGITTPSYPFYIDTGVSSSSSTYAYFGLTNQITTPIMTGITTGGVPSPTAKISVYAYGAMVSTEFDAFSDARLKENFEAITDTQALHFLRNARPVHFRWKQSGLGQYGFIAQDMARIGLSELILPVDDKNNPLLMSKQDPDGLVSPEGVKLSLNYNQFIALLTRNLQYLYHRLEGIKSEGAQLKSIETLKTENQLNQLEIETLSAELNQLEQEVQSCAFK